MPLLSSINTPVLHVTVVTTEKKAVFLPNMPFLFVLVFGIVLERKKFPEIGKVARNRKSCRNVTEHLVDSLNLKSWSAHANP